MSDETSSSQYSNSSKQLVNLGDVTSTGAPGSAAGSTYGAYSDALGVDDGDVAHTGASGSDGPTPPRDGSSASVTSPFAILDGTDAPDVSGSTSTSKNSLSAPFGAGSNPAGTGAGDGSAASSHTSPADQSSPWEKL